MAGIPREMWIVIRPSGERDFLTKEPLEGLEAWAKGLDATIVRYGCPTVVYTPPETAKEVKKTL